MDSPKKAKTFESNDARVKDQPLLVPALYDLVPVVDSK